MTDTVSAKLMVSTEGDVALCNSYNTFTFAELIPAILSIYWTDLIKMYSRAV